MFLKDKNSHFNIICLKIFPKTPLKLMKFKPPDFSSFHLMSTHGRQCWLVTDEHRTTVADTLLLCMVLHNWNCQTCYLQKTYRFVLSQNEWNNVFSVDFFITTIIHWLGPFCLDKTKDSCLDLLFAVCCIWHFVGRQVWKEMALQWFTNLSASVCMRICLSSCISCIVLQFNKGQFATMQTELRKKN